MIVNFNHDFIHQYTDRTRQKHRLLILANTGFLPFNNKIDFFEESITDMVDKQMHPRKLFYALVEQLRQKKIELPSYDRVARTITDKFHAFEAKVTKNIAEVITIKQQEALEQLVLKEGEPYERALLTRLKYISQSMQPAKIKQGMRNFLMIKKLHQELISVIEQLSLSSEAIKYYAGWVNKAKLTQLAEMADTHKRNLYLIAFIDYWYRLWQDNLVDILLKSVQQHLNKAAREVDLLIKERLPEKNRLAQSVITGFNNAKDTLDKVQRVVYDYRVNQSSDASRK